MGLFSPDQDKQSASTEPAAKAEPVVVPRPDATTGKNQPTPKRRDAEAARRQRANPQLDPKQARRKARQDASAERRKQTAAMDNTPARELMRNFVDSRFNLAEWSMPILMLLLLLVLVVSPMYPALVEPTTYATWLFMVIVGMDIFVMWRSFKKLAAERIPNEPLKGVFYYGFNRSLTLRRIRIPKPVVKRGEAI